MDAKQFISSRDWHKMGKWKHTKFLETTVGVGVNAEKLSSSLPFTTSAHLIVNYSQYTCKEEHEENVARTVEEIRRRKRDVSRKLVHAVEGDVEKMNCFSCEEITAQNLRELIAMLYRHGRSWYEIMCCDGALSKLLPESLPKQFELAGESHTPSSLLAAVALPKKLFPMIREQYHLLEMAVKLENKQGIEAELEEHARKFGWMNSLCWFTEPFSKEYYAKQVPELAGQNPQKLLEEKKLSREKQCERAERLLQALEKQFPQAWLYVDMVRDLTDLKEENWDAVSIAGTRLRGAFKKKAAEFHLSYNQFGEMTPAETLRTLESGRLAVEVDVLNERLRGYASIIPRGEQATVFVGKEAAEIEKIIAKDAPALEHLAGMPVFGGLVRGKACLIPSPDDVHKMRDGAVLVCPMSDPDYMPAIKKASAIVADQGGLLCHAAIIAREMQIPCVVGTEYATKFLKDGDEVEVDAVKGIVRKL